MPNQIYHTRAASPSGNPGQLSLAHFSLSQPVMAMHGPRSTQMLPPVLGQCGREVKGRLPGSNCQLCQVACVTLCDLWHLGFHICGMGSNGLIPVEHSHKYPGCWLRAEKGARISQPKIYLFDTKSVLSQRQLRSSECRKSFSFSA